MDYKAIKRLSVQELRDIKSEHEDEEDLKVKAILEYYLPQLNELDKGLGEVKLDNINVDFEGDVYNSNPHILAVRISCNLFSFNLEELFNNCGVLVSTKSVSYYTNRGIGTFLHAIKEDIAHVFGYSYLMYTDSVWNDLKKPNQRIMDKIGAKKVFRGLNNRSGNTIGIYIKDLIDYYENRDKEVSEELTFKVETI